MLENVCFQQSAEGISTTYSMHPWKLNCYMAKFRCSYVCFMKRIIETGRFEVVVAHCKSIFTYDISSESTPCFRYIENLPVTAITIFIPRNFLKQNRKFIANYELEVDDAPLREHRIEGCSSQAVQAVARRRKDGAIIAKSPCSELIFVTPLCSRVQFVKKFAVFYMEFIGIDTHDRTCATRGRQFGAAKWPRPKDFLPYFL